MGTAFTITSNTVISSLPYSSIFVPAATGAGDDSLQDFAEAVFEAGTLELVTEDAVGLAYGLTMPDNVAKDLGLHDLWDTQAVILTVDDLAAH